MRRRNACPEIYDPETNTFDEETARINALILERIHLNICGPQTIN